MTGWVGLIVIETRDDIGSVHVYVCMDCDFRKLVNYCYRLYTRPHHPASFKHHPASFKHHHASFKNHHASFKSGQVSGIMSSATMSLLLLMLLGYQLLLSAGACPADSTATATTIPLYVLVLVPSQQHAATGARIARDKINQLTDVLPGYLFNYDYDVISFIIGSAMKKSLVTDSAGWCFSVYSASTRI